MKPELHNLSVPEFNRRASLVAEHAPYRLPLYEAVGAGILAVRDHPRRAAISQRHLTVLPKPAVLLIGDAGREATGPSGWSGIKHATRWATSAIVHADDGETAHYRIAVMVAAAHGRILLVETTVEHRDDWIAALSPLPPLIFSPPPATQEGLQRNG